MKRLKKLFVLWGICVLVIQGHAQQQTFINDHEFWLGKLGTAKDSLYQQILVSFDDQIRRYPEDVKTQMEKCRIIEKAYYDSYEDYNPNYEGAKACAKALVTLFPTNPEALLYQAEFLYGDSLVTHLEQLKDLADRNPEIWKHSAWKVYRQLAEQYQVDEKYENAAKYGELAVAHNDTLDMTLVLARSYKKLSSNIKAIDVLLSRLDSTDQPWVLNQKGRLLLELGVPDKAMEVFHMSSKKNANAEDADALAQAMIDNGLVMEARAYLVKASENNLWSDEPLLKLLNYDLKYSSADSAEAVYARFTSKDFWNDPVGIYRLRLSFKSPLSSWSFSDVGRILLLVVLFILPFIIPYLWILPIHYYGMWQKQKGKIFSETTFQWGLKHFWLVCSLWLLCDTVGYLIFDYNTFTAMFKTQISTEEVDLISKHNANSTLFFFMGCLIFTMAFLKNEDIVNFIAKMRKSLNAIGLGIGLAFVLKIGWGFYSVILQRAGISLEESSVIASVNESILSINKFYNPYLGFLFVVILVPFYEEVLFRGIILSACERNMKFVFANILQSLVFALVHQSLNFLLFYFAFGMIAGFYRQKSQGLIISTSMHMMNNLLAFTAMTVRS